MTRTEKIFLAAVGGLALLTYFLLGGPLPLPSMSEIPCGESCGI